MRRLYPIILAIGALTATTMMPVSSKADLFGGDVVVLGQILSNAVQQLATLQQVMGYAHGESDLLGRVNRDIEKSLNEIHAMQDVVRETTDIGKIRDPQQLLLQLQDVYGRIPRLGDLKGILLTDRIAGTGLGVDNDTYDHAHLVDQAAVTLENEVKGAAPGRAQQLAAQSQTTVLHSLAQMERTNATLLRVASAQLALESQHEKDHIDSFDKQYSGIATSRAAETDDLQLEGIK